MTTSRMRELIPDPSELKRMHPAELAGYLLDVMVTADRAHHFMLHRRDCARQIAESYRVDGKPPDYLIMTAIAEAWSWLEVHQLIVMDVGQSDNWFVVTARGDTTWKAGDVQQLVASEELPTSMLHPSLQGRARAMFLARDFDTAVFKAFHGLEVAIRDGAQLGPELIGTKLVARAFDPNGGPLTDMDSEAGEREALRNLMAGAIGYCKNPQSHRHVGLDARAARELLVLASHLLGIVDERRKG
jgi:uncharacterized protein (TIGR02391 family)